MAKAAKEWGTSLCPSGQRVYWQDIEEAVVMAMKMGVAMLEQQELTMTRVVNRIKEIPKWTMETGVARMAKDSDAALVATVAINCQGGQSLFYSCS